MSDAGDSRQEKLLGWMQGILRKKEQQPYPSNAPMKGPIQNAALSNDAPVADDARRASLTQGNLPTSPLTIEEPEEASKRRITVINAFLKDPTSDPSFLDRTYIFRILTEERSYHQALVVELNVRLRELPPPTPPVKPNRPDPNERARNELKDRIMAAWTYQAQLYSIMKGLTGIKGNTGGTGFM